MMKSGALVFIGFLILSKITFGLKGDDEKTMKKLFVVLNLILLIVVFGYSVIKEENNLKKKYILYKNISC